MNAYCVMGPESSGNRLMTRLLVHAGCVGDGDAVQRWDASPPTGESPLVILELSGGALYVTEQALGLADVPRPAAEAP